MAILGGRPFVYVFAHLKYRWMNNWFFNFINRYTDLYSVAYGIIIGYNNKKNYALLSGNNLFLVLSIYDFRITLS